MQSASAQAALQAAQALTGAGTVPPSAPATPNNILVANGQAQDIQGGPNTVLRVIIEHMVYPINVDILYVVSIFSIKNREWQTKRIQ